MRISPLLYGIFFCLLPQLLMAAKVDSVNGKSVTIFLQSMDDEDVQVGQLIYLTDSSGRRKATLKVTNNRGVMADTTLVKGSPSKKHKVLMPHQVAKKAPVKKSIRKARPKKVRPKPVVAAPVRRPKPKPPRRPVKRQQRVAKKAPQPLEPEELEEPALEPSDVRLEPLEGEEDSLVAEEPTVEPSVEEPQDTKGPSPHNWNISMDILSLAGLLYDYQVFSFMAERRVLKSLSLGAQFNFGTFESNEGLPVTDKPLVRRMEYGAFARYNFSGDVFESGIYSQLAVKAAQESWVATQNFSAATDGGFVGALTVGYQWILGTMTLRFGYAAQYSSLPREAEFESVTQTRTQDLQTGIAHYAIIQFGILF